MSDRTNYIILAAGLLIVAIILIGLWYEAMKVIAFTRYAFS